MKTINKLSIVLMTSIVLLFGCSKSYLDTTPEGGISPDQFYKTDADATSAVAAVYQMYQAMYASPWTSLWMLKELPSGDLLTGGGSRGDQSNYEEIAEFRYGSNNNVITQVYANAYYTILRANLVVDFVNPDTSTYKKYVVAEAKTLRAMMYFDLVTLWGPVPLVLHKLNPSEYQQPNSTVAEIWAQIEKDLTEAIPDLPIRSKLALIKSDVSRVSKGTAQALLGKALLYEKKYADAATQLKAVITSGEYELNTDYSQILKISSEFGKESLFEVAYSISNQTWSTPNIWADPGRTATDNVHWQLCGPRGDAWFDGGHSGLIAGWGFAYPTKDLYDAFVAAGDTCRLRSSIMDEAHLIALGGKIRSSVDNSYPYGCQGFVRLKYGPWASETCTDASGYTKERNYGTNLRVIRYADVLLMAAEALNRQPSPDDATALTYINLVRDRAKLSALSSTGDALFNDIKTERQLELAFEGVRFQDIIRWGNASADLANVGKVYYLGTFTGGTENSVSTGGSFTSPKNLLFPFPHNELLVNPKITQNTGYDN